MFPALRELQHQFLECVLKNGESIYSAIRTDQLTPQDRLRIYRNNTYIGLAEILKQTYPIIAELLEQLPFKRAAYTYIHQNPPQSGNMTDYGVNFGNFLESFALTEQYPFLKDIAQLEWLENQSYSAEDAVPLDPKSLLGLGEGQLFNLKFQLLPSCQLLNADHALDRVWNTFQSDPKSITLDNIPVGKTYLVIVRPYYKIFVHSLSSASFSFLTYLNQGKTLLEAYEETPELRESADLQKRLTELFQLQVLTSTHLNE